MNCALFHGGNAGSNPAGDAKYIQQLTEKFKKRVGQAHIVLCRNHSDSRPENTVSLCVGGRRADLRVDVGGRRWAMSPAEAEDDSHGEAHVVLPRRLSRAGGRVFEPGHHVFGLNQA